MKLFQIVAASLISALLSSCATFEQEIVAGGSGEYFNPDAGPAVTEAAPFGHDTGDFAP